MPKLIIYLEGDFLYRRSLSSERKILYVILSFIEKYVFLFISNTSSFENSLFPSLILLNINKFNTEFS